MGLLGVCTSACAIIAAVVGVLLASAPSPLDPVGWAHPPPLLPLEGVLAPNDVLVGTEHLHVDEVIAPESFAIARDGKVYAGCGDGRVVAFDADGSNPETVFFTGGFVSPAGRGLQSKNGADYSSRLQEDCHGLAQRGELHQHPEKEEQCGRPLGLDMGPDGSLYFVDAYHGLFCLDLETGQATQLLDAQTVSPKAIGEPGSVAPEVGMQMRFLNDLTVTQSGVIFFTDSSWKNVRAKNRPEVIDGAPRGRLLRFDPATGAVHVVLCGLHFPNGVEVDESGSKLLLVESMRLRMLELPLTDLDPAAPGPGLADALGFCGESEALPSGVKVFMENIPGFADNFGFDDKTNCYWVGLATKVAQPFSLIDFMFKTPLWVRHLLGKAVPLKHLEKVIPRFGFVLQLGRDGAVQGAFMDPTGRTPFVSEAVRHPTSGYVFLGSHSNRFLGRIKLP